ncbi:UBN2 domain-containing protein [Cephalotus follicularis]|uniref:UBN2 domain-containing protein n=1 Tax=Cephalotus follicularis TaxID=3775 RepID=A0A1Q3BEI8_CEPFO|nr:UBN2 domain-containing protein [Cephalotus follicularis]
MTIFLQSLDYHLWHIVVNGPRMPTRTIEGVVSLKPENEFNDNDFKMLQLNSEAKHVLFCAVGPNEFNRISSCDMAKEMWDLLEVTYEGTNQVKESKISMLVHEYELFLIHDNECISDMFTRFTTIVNSLKNLGKSYSNQELVRKILSRLGHVSTSCIYRNNLCFGKTRRIWVPKGTFVTNLQGPKFKWVPKT